MMTALASLSKSPVYAQSVSRDNGPFVCPACRKAVIVKKGRKRIHHFSHKSMNSFCALARDKDRVSQRHMQIQTEIFEAFMQQSDRFKVTMEKQIGHHWTDIAVVDRETKQKYAIEIQRSPIGLDQIEGRTNCYSSRGYATLWIIAKDLDCGAGFPSDADSEQQRIPAWIRDLHKLHYSVVFYHVWDQILEPVHFEIATSYVEYREWGNGNSGGGYDRILKGSRTLKIAPFNVSIDELVPIRNKFFQGAPLIVGLPYGKRWWKQEPESEKGQSGRARRA